MAVILSLVSCVRHLPLSQTKPVVVICPGAIGVLELEAADVLPIGVDLRIEIGSDYQLQSVTVHYAEVGDIQQ